MTEEVKEVVRLTAADIDELASDYADDRPDAIASMFGDTTYRRLTHIDGINDPSHLDTLNAVINYYSHAAVAFKHPNVKLLTLDRKIVGNTAEIAVRVDDVQGFTATVTYVFTFDKIDDVRRLSKHVKP